MRKRLFIKILMSTIFCIMPAIMMYVVMLESRDKTEYDIKDLSKFYQETEPGIISDGITYLDEEYTKTHTGSNILAYGDIPLSLEIKEFYLTGVNPTDNSLQDTFADYTRLRTSMPGLAVVKNCSDDYKSYTLKFYVVDEKCKTLIVDAFAPTVTIKPKSTSVVDFTFYLLDSTVKELITTAHHIIVCGYETSSIFDDYSDSLVVDSTLQKETNNDFITASVNTTIMNIGTDSLTSATLYTVIFNSDGTVTNVLPKAAHKDMQSNDGYNSILKPNNSFTQDVVLYNKHVQGELDTNYYGTCYKQYIVAHKQGKVDYDYDYE